MNRFLHRLKTRTGVIATVAAVLVGVIFYQLGQWQLSRADEKRAILTSHNNAMQLAPLNSIDSLEVEEVLYRQVELRGAFDQQHQFLLDNRTLAGQAGFEVITPFYVTGNDSAEHDTDSNRRGDQYILVNRGWIGHSGDRKVTLTRDPQLELETTLRGVVTRPSRGFILKDSAVDSGADSQKGLWPMTLQFIDYGTIAAKLDKIPVMDAVVIAARGQAGSLRYNWKPVASGAEKHLGYAFQWFALLTALIALYLYLMVIKKSNE